MQAAARMSEYGAKWRAVSMETEAGLVMGRDMYEEAKIVGLTNVGSRLGQDRDEGA